MFIKNPDSYLRLYHLDIAGLKTSELIDEFNALRPQLWQLSADDWRRERVAAIIRELISRRSPST
jgi:uncharacterized protein YecA (UPF0149 family)